MASRKMLKNMTEEELNAYEQELSDKIDEIEAERGLRHGREVTRQKVLEICEANGVSLEDVFPVKTTTRKKKVEKTKD